MWYLKVSSSLLIAVALICMIQNAISLAIDPLVTEEQWSTLENSTDKNDLKKISKLCKVSIDNFNEKLENAKTIANKKLPEHNKTIEDISNLVTDIKNQVKNASADLVTVRKLVQKTALRFRDTFKSLVSFTELDSESVNKELESIKKTTVDSKKPLVNSVIRSFGNRYDLNKLANKVLEISSDREKLKNNYDEKKKTAKRELNSLWNSLSNHSKTVNDNALKAMDTFFEGIKSVKSVKKKVKTFGEDALNQVKEGNEIIKLKNAVELAKSLKLNFEDEWNLDSGELTYSEEQKKTNTNATDDKQSDVQENEQDKSNENISTNDIKPDLPKTEQEPIENIKSNKILPAQAEIEKLPLDKAVSPIEETQLSPKRKNKDETKIMQPTIPKTKNNPMDNYVSDTIDSPNEETPSIPNTNNKDKTVIVQPEASYKNQNSVHHDDSKSDSSIKETSFNHDIKNNEVLNTPLKDSIDNKSGKRINKITRREKTLLLPWEKLIQLENPHVSQQSMKCENLFNNVTPDFDNIRKAAKNSIQVTKSYKNLQKIENETIKQFYDKMVDTNTNLCNYLVNAADDVCAKVTPINQRFETKFKNDPNIQRIKYLLGKQYDPNQYILKVLDDANYKTGIGGIKKTTYYKMLAVAHNLNHETKEMENAALYAMNKIHEGKLAATNLQKKFNKEKASKACYIKKILQEKENEDDKKNKEENKEKVKESINDDTTTEPLKPVVNLDSVDAIQPTTVTDDNEPIINNNLRTQEPERSSMPLNKDSNINTSKEKYIKIKKAPETELLDTADNEHDTEIPDHVETEKVDSNGDNATNEETDDENTSVKPKMKRRRKRIDPKDGKEISEEYETSEEDDNNSNKSVEKKSDEAPQSELSNTADNEHDTEIPKHVETEKVDSNGDNVTNEETDDENTSVKPKMKRRRKRIDPKDGKEISEEYETSEEDDNKSNKSVEKKSDEAPDTEFLDTADNEHDTEIPEHVETEKVDSNGDNATNEDTDDENTSVKPKMKRRRKRIDPKDGKEISEEYETSEEDDNKSNKSVEKKSDEAPESELSNTADNEHDTEIPEHVETEKVDSNGDNATNEETDDGNTSVKPKMKRRRKRIDPKDGKEISEENETSEEDASNSNKSAEKKSDEAPESELSNTADNEHDTEIPDHVETEKVDSNGDNATNEETDEGNTSVKPKMKHRRKRIDPKDGKEISEEYETSEEDDNKSNKSVEKKSDEAPDTELLDTADNEHDTEIPEHVETEKVDSNGDNATNEETDDENTSVKPKMKRRRKRIDPKDGKEISEENETSEEDASNSNKSAEKKSDEAPESELSNTADIEHDTEIPDHVETEKVDSNGDNATNEETDEGNTSVKPKMKHRRKRIDPKDGKEISEEYETPEEDASNSNKSAEKKSDEAPESELSNTADNEHDTEIPDHVETEKVDSNGDNATNEETDDENTSVKPKMKRRRKRIDPKDGKEISEEYETSEEDDNNSNKSVEKKSDEAPQSELSNTTDNEHDTEIPEHVETEKVDSNGDNATNEETDEGNTSVKPKMKHRRKRIDPKDGKEISEEYETSEEDDNKSNKSVEKKSDEAPDTELLDTADNEHDTEIPEHVETEKVDSNGDNATNEDTDDENTSVKPKMKRRRKRIDPKDGKEISEEYETSEEDDNKSNKSVEKKSDKAPDTELLDTADNEHDTEIPEHVETEKVDSNGDNATNEETDEGNTSVKPKMKHRRKRIDPKDGKEISEEYETSEEDDNNSNKSVEKKSDEAPDTELLDTADNEHDTEIPDHVETEKVDSNGDNATNEETDEGNTSVKPKMKRRRKRIVPKDGKEISEEYETSEEDGNKSNKSVEKKSDEAPDTELLDTADNEHDTEIPEHVETEKVNVAGEDPENITRETNELDEFENLNSVEGTELNGVDNDKIIPAADSMGEDSSSIESSYEETEQSYPNDSNDNHKNNNDGKYLDDKISKRQKKLKDPKNGQQISDDYVTVEEQEDESTMPDYEDIHENKEILDNDVQDRRQSNEQEVFDENKPKIRSNEAIDKPNDLEEQNDGNNKPNKKMRNHRKRKDPKNDNEVSDEYETIEEQEDESPVARKSISTSVESPDGEPVEFTNPDHESETPENEEISDNEEIPDNYVQDRRQSNEQEVFDENEPEIRSNDAINKPNDLEEQNDGNNKPNKKMRNHRKRKDPKNDNEVSDEYETIEEQEDESPVARKSISTSVESPDGEPVEFTNPDHESETPENEEISDNEEIPDNYVQDRRQSNEQEVFDENEPEIRSNEAIDKPNDLEEQNDGNNKPNKKMRNHRKRKDPKNDNEVSDEYETIEEQEDESPVARKSISTSVESPDGEPVEFTNPDHESETPENEEISDNEEIPDNYVQDRRQSNEQEVFDENEPEIRSNEAIDKPNDLEEQNDGNNKPNKKMRNHRKRKDPKNDNEVSDEYETIEEQEDESPIARKSISTSVESPDGEPVEFTNPDHESETPENEEISDNEEIPDNYVQDRRQSNEQEVFDENEPEIRSNEAIDKPNDLEEQNDGNNKPNKKMRNHRKRKDPKNDNEVSDEYETIEEQEDESPVARKSISTSVESPDGEPVEFTNPDHESETPENEEISDNEEIPDNYVQDRRQSNEQEVFDENEPEIRSNEAIDKPNDLEEQNDGNNKPNKKMRNHRKRKDPKNDNEVSDEYETIEEQEDESPVARKSISTSVESPDGEPVEFTNPDHESETPENEEISDNEEIPDNYVQDRRQSNEQEVFDENEPEIRSNDAINKPNDLEEQNDGNNKPNKKMRNHRKRKDPKNDNEVSDEYETIEEQEDESPVARKSISTSVESPDGEPVEFTNPDHESETPENEEISDNEEIPDNYVQDRRQSNEQEVFDENEPEIRSNEAIDKPNDLEEQNDGNNKPNKKMRNHRKRKDPKNDNEVSDEYETIEEQEDESPVARKSISTSVESPDGEPVEFTNPDHESETPENEEISDNEEIPDNYVQDRRQSNEQEVFDENEPEIRSNEAIDKPNDLEEQNDGNNKPNKKMRNHRKRKDPKNDNEVSDEYETIEEQEDESPIARKSISTSVESPDGEPVEFTNPDHESETPENEEISDNEEIPDNYVQDRRQSNEQEVFDENEPEIRSNEAIDKPNDLEEQNDGNNKPNKKMRNHRKRKDPKNDNEVSDEYETIEEQEDESPVARKSISTSVESPDGEPVEFTNPDHESETPENEEISDNEEIPDNYVQDRRQSNEQEVFDENEPEIRSNEAIDKPNDLEEQNDGNNKPNKKMRNHRKRKDPKNDNEVSDEYETIEEQEDESPVARKSISTSVESPDGEPVEFTNPDHESETPENEEISDNEEIPDNYVQDRRQSNEQEVFDENEPEIRSNDAINKPNDLEEQNDGNNKPNKKMRNHRKRKDPKNDNEVSDEYETIEEQEDESPVARKSISTSVESPDGEPVEFTNPDHESETPENEEISDNEEIPDNYVQDRRQSNEQEVFDENEPEIRSNEAIDKPNDVEEQNDGNNKPNKKMRNHRKRKDPKNDNEVSDEYETIEEQADEPLEVGRNIDTPTGIPGGESTGPTKTDNEFETPEYEEVPDNSEIPKYNQSNKHVDISELEPKSNPDEEKVTPQEIVEQYNTDNQPNKKIRRHRKHKDFLHSHEISEEYETIEDKNDEIKILETPNMVTYDQFNKNAIPSPNDNISLVNPKRFKKRKNPEYDHEISEEYDSFEEYDDEAELKNHNLRPEINDENRDLNNNVIPNIVNDVLEDELKSGYSEPTVVPQKIFEENNEAEPVLSEYLENTTPEASPINDVDKTMNVSKPRPRKVRGHNKSRRPKSGNENHNKQKEVKDENMENYPLQDEGVNYGRNPYDNNNVQEKLQETGNGRITDIENDIEQPELTEYPENSVVVPEASYPNDIDETINVTKPRPRKIRRHRKSRQPKTVNENDNVPKVVNDKNIENYPVEDQSVNYGRNPYDNNNVQEKLPETGSSGKTDIENDIEQPELTEYPENSVVAPEASYPNDVDKTINVTKPRPRKIRRHRKSKQPKTVNENDKVPEVVIDENIETNPVEDQSVNNGRIPYDDDNVQEELPETDKTANLNDTDSTINSKQPRRKKHVRRKKISTAVDEITPNNLDTENSRIHNDEKSVETPETQKNDAGRSPPKKRRLRRIRTYMVNKETNERIPINEQTYTTTDGLPDTPKNKLEPTEAENSDNPDSNEDNDNYSSFLFKEYNSDQCKRDAFNRFKKVKSQDAKQIAYQSVLDTSEMRSNMLATIKNAIGNVKASKTLNDVDQSLRTVSYSLKTDLKQTVSDLVIKVIPLAKDFLKTAENLKELYKNGPQSTYKMLSNILDNESTIPDSAKDVLKLISPQFDVDELINNIFEKPFNTKLLKEKKAKAQRKLIGLSKHMDTAISNIDCFVLSAMSAVGIGADTLKLLKSGRVIMSDKHPRSKALRDAVGIIKSGKKIRNNDVGFTPMLTPSDGFTESDEDDDDEDPDQVAQKNEEFLKTVPDLDDNIPVPKKVPIKRQSLGVIVVHPDKKIEYKEVTDTSQLKKFVGDQTKKYKLQSKNKHLKFLKLNSKKLIDSMVEDVKKKAEKNGMSRKEMVEEIIKNLKSS